MNETRVLAEEIAMALVTIKAYDLPSTVEGLGLPIGDPQDAWRSKRLYVLGKIREMSLQQLIELGERVLKVVTCPDLREVLDLTLDKSQLTVSIITRKKILEDLDQRWAIEGRRSLIEMLSRIWQLQNLPPSNGPSLRFENLEDEIWQHMVRNPDWPYAHLFDVLKLDRCSQRRFFHFLEECVHPLSREGDAQLRLVEALNERLATDGFELRATDIMSGQPIFRVIRRLQGVDGRVKNLIFAADGPKPDLVLADAISNDVRIVRNAEYCLAFDQPLPAEGLLWRHLVAWWATRENTDPTIPELERSLYSRLFRSLSSKAEKHFFRRYFKTWRSVLGERLPALIPQVYLHYDPLTLRERALNGMLPRQRMDFLLLLSSHERVVIEIDGKHHYADADRASPSRYARMVAADRDLRLVGYEVYRFGGTELLSDRADETVDAFIRRLLERHRWL